MNLPELHPDDLLQRDVSRLIGQRKRLQKMSPDDPKHEKSLADFAAKLAASKAKVEARNQAAPRPAYDPELPITARKDDIVAAIRDHRVVVVAGATGSGKSTQLPKMALEAGRGRRGLIGCTQPRRIAARSVARRVAEELDSELGQAVGFQVRFNDRVSDNTFIKFMTDGILLAEVHGDRRLNRYDTLIIDEAHERSLNIDFLLGYLKQLLDRRPDLKLIITSATIDTARFAEHFGDAPVIDVEGRSYPVTVEYQPPNDGEALEQQVRRAVARATKIDPRGDILVFLPGEREIFQASRALSRAALPNTEVLPLYARLPASRQDAIFKSGVGRRIVLATNVAETSLTVPGIRFVIDSGLARISRYATHSKVLRLPVEPVSQASCNQRAGRCGRVGPGTCIRLFDQADFDARPEYTEPEIQRAGLVGVVLEMLALGLGDPEAFPFIDPPPTRLVNEAWSTLVELQAVDEARALTPLGRQLAALPVDARHGRMLIEADQRGALAEALVLVAALGLQDPRERPPDQQQAADEAHAQFRVAGSDFLGLLTLWSWWQNQRTALSRSQADKLAKRSFLSPLRLHEWGQLVAQLRELVRENGWAVGRIRTLDEGVAESVHRALLSGLLAQVGRHDEDGDYVGARGHKVRIFPGSALGRSRPGWIMAAELVETSRPWARTVATIKPEWLEQQAAHLTRSRVFDPHWDRRAGRVMGYQQVTLYGLTLVEKRRIHYGPHDPDTARELMILHALVRGEMDFEAGFLKRNRQLVDELATHEHKRRARDVLADESARVEFFDQRLPPQIFTVKAFGRWYEGLDEKQRAQLLYDHATLLRDDAEPPGEEFPDRLELDGEVFELDYRFEPAHPADGVTVICPLHRLNRLDPDRLQWLVPGLRADAVKGLIGTLPKSKRRAFVPLADYAKAALEALGEPAGSLHERLAAELARIGGLEITPDDFQLERLDEHLRFNVRVLDEGGRILAESRDLEGLQADLGERARRDFMARQAEEWQRDGLTEFDDLVLPEQVRTRAGDPAWPALIDQGRAVGLRLFDDEAEARAAHHGGIHRLLLVRLADKLKYVAKSHRLSQQAALAWTRVEDVATLERTLGERLVGDLVDDAWAVRDAAGLDALEKSLRPILVDRCRAAIEVLDRVVLRWHAVRRRLDDIGPAQPSAQADIESQLEDLVYPSFVADIRAERLGHYPRYLDAIDARLDALELDPRRDVQRQAETDPWWQHYLEHLAGGGTYTDALDRYRWLVEEYRVQVFAQQLGTAEKVSKKRLEQAWGTVLREAA
ncbi:ATP-dependent RNA helicase HrpA [Wenzhouxiangella sp. XN79A]|uniref:ATP-dependent RNA helicase HrpA n=1 Tax=Wenzhouxiangella sp. XN79A TaxID=2724193 RepID=UPI00144A94AE|nr:ATP-dependent RNA helicase HrpA [Wenzhouxiangella sp. XN79A]NKI36054.1 ATP-dependent RNA helicase HrpA [Wenzhouxiangella sp. XN79A]